jgi:hypothetical protein
MNYSRIVVSGSNFAIILISFHSKHFPGDKDREGKPE